MPASADSGVRREYSSPNEGHVVEVNIDARKHEIEMVTRSIRPIRPVLVGVANADHDPTGIGMDHGVISPSQVSARIEPNVAVHDDKDIIMIRTREPVGECDGCGIGSLDLDHPAGIDGEVNRLLR